MRWFSFGEEGARLPWGEWGRAVRDPEDMLASIALGDAAHRRCVRTAGLRAEEGAEGALTAFAHILHHMLDELDEDRVLELRYHLQEGWMRAEPWLWERPEEVLWPIGGPVLAELLALRHGLERVVGPELLRLAWSGMVASGRRMPLGPPTLGTAIPLALLDRMLVERIPPFLDGEERGGMAFLRSALRLSERASTEELAAALSAQALVLHKGRVHLDGRLGGGGWYTGREVLEWRRRGLRSCCLLIPFRVMFLASVTGASGPLRVAFPD